MNSKSIIHAAGLLVTGALAMPAMAVTSMTSADYAIIGNGFSASDSDTAMDATATSSVPTSGFFISSGGVEATQNADGTSVLRAGVGAADGLAGHNGQAVARFQQTETNTSGGDLDFSMDYLLQDMSIYLNGDFGGASNDGNPFPGLSGGSVGGFLDYQVIVNGSPVFNAHLDAFGGSENYTTANTVNLSGTLIPQNCSTFGCTGMLVEIADISGTLDLGTLGDGDSITVETVLTAGFYANGFENEVDVRFGDPSALNLTGALTGTTTGGGGPTVVPLPAGALLLGTALFGLGATRRRRH